SSDHFCFLPVTCSFLVLFFFLLMPPPLHPPLFPSTTLSRSRSHRPEARTLLPRIQAPPASPHRVAAVLARIRRLAPPRRGQEARSEEHTSELQSLTNLVCRLLLEKKKKNKQQRYLLDSQLHL